MMKTSSLTTGAMLSALALAATAVVVAARPADAITLCTAPSYTAGSQEELSSALSCASGDGVDSTITLTQSINVDEVLVYSADDGALVIEGGGHVVTLTDKTGSTGSVSIDDDSGTMDITLSDLSVSGFNPAPRFSVNVGGDATLDRVRLNGLIGAGGTSGPGAVIQSGGTVDIADSSFVSISSTANVVYAAAGGSVARTFFAFNAPGVSALWLHGGVPGAYASIEDSAFWSNTTGAGAAALTAIDGAVTGSTFESNVGNYGAGGLRYQGFGDPYSLLVSNSTFSGNSTQIEGGAISVNGTVALSIDFSTFADNSSLSPAGAIWALIVPGTPSVSLFGSVVSGSSPQCMSVIGPSFSSAGYNSLSDVNCAGIPLQLTDTFGVDPMLGALADNGGPTKTMLPGEGSALIDAIPVAAASIAADQRGVARPQGEGFDIGAVETKYEDVVEEEYDGSAETVDFVIPTPEGDVLGYATCAVDAIEIGNTPASGLSGTPGSVSAVLGGLSFTIELAPGCDATDITLELPRPVNSVFKVDGSTWTDMSDTLSADGLTVEYTAVDGGAYDEDGTADGWIVDPVVPALDVSFTG